jgi:actin-related protein
VHQNTRCGTGASTLPPAVIVSITSEPESDEVTKNTITRTMAMNEVICCSGSASSIEQLQFERRICDGW